MQFKVKKPLFGAAIREKELQLQNEGLDTDNVGQDDVDERDIDTSDVESNGDHHSVASNAAGATSNASESSAIIELN